ncbi:MAG: hypothetical protein H0V37_11940 [Chloroflexia bacterium]|nr:hypothetical protein [Chloroflexia bacterium]
MVTKFPPQLEEDLQTLMETGEYDDTTDILAQGVRLLARRREKAQRLKELLQVSGDQYERGEYREFTPELRQQLWESALRRYERGEEPSPDVCP